MQTVPVSLRALLFALLSVPAFSLPAQQTFRVYFIGNSVTDSVNYGDFDQLATSQGYNHLWGRHVILGSPLDNIWASQDAGFFENPYGRSQNALLNYTWDAVSLQPFDRSLESDLLSCSNFITLGAATSPNAQFYIYARWPRTSHGDFDTQWLRQYEDGGFGREETRDYFETLTQELRDQHPTIQPVLMVPVGHVMYEINQLMKGGQLPGYTNVFDLYSDGIHLTGTGRYLVACTYFATLYRQNPIGTPVPAGYGNVNAVNPNMAQTIQETVWNVVRSVPLAGVPADGMSVITAFLPNGVTNSPYSASLQAVGGTQPYSWSQIGGTLPPGVMLNADGTLSGTPTALGLFNFDVEVNDSSTNSATKTLSLTISTNAPLSIATVSIPGGNRGSFYNTVLQSVGGQGAITWSIIAGGLPVGMRLEPGGRLTGSPGASGSFQFTVRAQDATPGTPQSDTQLLTLNVAPPLPATLIVKQISAPVAIDGALDSFWQLDQQASNTGLGSPNNTTEFGVMWDYDNVYVAARVTDDSPQVDSVVHSDDDAVEIFIDALNDKESVFNVDDRQLVVTRDGRLFEQNGRTGGVTFAVTTSSTGFVVECAIPWTNLNVVPYENIAIGLDLANSDDDNGGARDAFQRWRSVDPGTPAPADFGEALLTGEPVNLGYDGSIAREPFNYPDGPLFGASGAGSLGWSGAWDVQNSNSERYLAAGVTPLAYLDLLRSPKYGSGGGDFLTSGRGLDVNGVFASYATSDLIQKDGTTLWISALMRKEQATDTDLRLKFHESGIRWGSTDRSIDMGFFGAASKVGSTRYWSLRHTLGASTVVRTSTVLTPGQTALLVMRLQFEAGATDRADLFVNPPVLNTTNIPAPSATISNVTISFRSMHFYGGSGVGNGSVDEIRFGRTFAEVTPTFGGEAPPTGSGTTGGATTGAGTTGGSSTGGSSTGGSSTGGSSTGGDSTGGDSTGGDSTGGDSTGGDSTGGDSTGGDSTGGDSTDGVTGGGTGVGTTGGSTGSTGSHTALLEGWTVAITKPKLNKSVRLKLGTVPIVRGKLTTAAPNQLPRKFTQPGLIELAIVSGSNDAALVWFPSAKIGKVNRRGVATFTTKRAGSGLAAGPLTVLARGSTNFSVASSPTASVSVIAR